jgi:hypothetical protein
MRISHSPGRMEHSNSADEWNVSMLIRDGRKPLVKGSMLAFNLADGTAGRLGWESLCTDGFTIPENEASDTGILIVSSQTSVGRICVYSLKTTKCGCPWAPY